MVWHERNACFYLMGQLSYGGQSTWLDHLHPSLVTHLNGWLSTRSLLSQQTLWLSKTNPSHLDDQSTTTFTCPYLRPWTTSEYVEGYMLAIFYDLWFLSLWQGIKGQIFVLKHRVSERRLKWIVVIKQLPPMRISRSESSLWHHIAKEIPFNWG